MCFMTTMIKLLDSLDGFERFKNRKKRKEKRKKQAMSDQRKKSSLSREEEAEKMADNIASKILERLGSLSINHTTVLSPEAKEEKTKKKKKELVKIEDPVLKPSVVVGQNKLTIDEVEFKSDDNALEELGNLLDDK